MVPAIVVLVVIVTVTSLGCWRLWRAIDPGMPEHKVRSDGSFGFLTWLLGDVREGERVPDDEQSEPQR
jgi:hypothetical protein